MTPEQEYHRVMQEYKNNSVIPYSRDERINKQDLEGLTNKFWHDGELKKRSIIDITDELYDKLGRKPLVYSLILKNGSRAVVYFAAPTEEEGYELAIQVTGKEPVLVRNYEEAEEYLLKQDFEYENKPSSEDKPKSEKNIDDLIVAA